MNKLKPLLIPAIIILVFSFALRFLNLIPKPPADYKPHAMVFITLFWNEEDKQRLIESGYKKFGIFLIYDGAKKEDKKDGDSPLVATSIVDGGRVPHGKSGVGPFMVITKVSDDKTYGYTPKNPIKVGGDMKKEGSRNERRYLNSLYGPKGEIIEYERLGSCCFFKTPNGFEGMGLQDKYEIAYKGLKEPIILYLNMYDYEEPKAPYGFSVRSERVIRKSERIFKLRRVKDSQ